MGYLDRLKKSEKHGGEAPKEPKEFGKVNCFGFLGTPPGPSEKSEAAYAEAVQGNTPARHWILHFRDRDPVEVFRSPPATWGEVLRDNPEAVAAEPAPMLDTDQGEGDPLGDDSGAEVRYCVMCWHRRRPGLSAGYCGGNRLDLAHAYGLSHPLRELPADKGKTFGKWQATDNEKGTK